MRRAAEEADLLDSLFKAGCVWITQVSIAAGVGSPLSFLKRKCSQHLYPLIAERWSWIRSARPRSTFVVLLEAKFQGFIAPTEASLPSKLLLTVMSLRCGWDDLRIIFFFLPVYILQGWPDS